MLCAALLITAAILAGYKAVEIMVDGFR